MAEQKLLWKVIIKQFLLIHLNSTVYSKAVTVAGLTQALLLPVVDFPVKQITDSLEAWCPAHPSPGGTSPCSERGVFTLPIQHGSVSQPRASHLTFPGEHVLFTHRACGNLKSGRYPGGEKHCVPSPALWQWQLWLCSNQSSFFWLAVWKPGCLSSHHSEPG